MERNAYFDNARLLLIFLVVFGHMIQPFTDQSNGINSIYTWIYTFHMPAFIFLAGFFAKGAGNKDYVIKLAKKLLVPYIIFQLIYSGYYFLLGRDNWLTDGLFYPHWALWFLFSLFCWHILLFWFKKLPPLLGLLIAVQIGLIVGYFGQIGQSFSLSRTFVFFPFFLLGYWLTTEKVMFLKKKSIKIASLVIMVAVAIGIYYAPEIKTGWLLASKSYGDLGLPQYGGIARFLVYLTSFLMAASVLAWVPRKRNVLTSLGSRTLYVYLLHGFFIQYFRETDFFQVDSVFDLTGIAVIAALIVLVLSSKPVLGIWQPFIEGKMSILKRVINEKRTSENNV
ncbi:acyltransferase family protein [Virgibacillus sp. 179-BFC.A HS]|uniref:Acyltransferase family protein n=1 Tax=Tigheibacillus jepli TaxID=3035914 RepID=A0ABU5CDU3_9BACI|nr:acyltransferase family protein [Virgibacillus sp. 179-BFC.A HS]MDY0404505.1 acyltransferase family protein [Virgibacillus sp. 179-BFC.A HS]